MGVSQAATGGSRNSYARRLWKLAGELEPVRLPWYESQPRWNSPTPSPGWWWIPKGHELPVYLGHNHVVAEVQLRTLLDGQELPRR